MTKIPLKNEKICVIIKYKIVFSPRRRSTDVLCRAFMGLDEIYFDKGGITL